MSGRYDQDVDDLDDAEPEAIATATCSPAAPSGGLRHERRPGDECVADPRRGRGEPRAGIVRLTGFAGLIAGAFSMASGEYVSMQAQRELLQRELDIERRALRREPKRERDELLAI